MLKETLPGVLSGTKSTPAKVLGPALESMWGKFREGSMVSFRTYRGVAGILRRRLVFAVAFALVYGSLALMIGLFLREFRLLDPLRTYLIIGLLFLVGLMINGWLILRLMRKPLDAIERVEDGLVKMAAGKDFRLDQDVDPLDFQATPFLQAYYGMLQHIDALENGHLEFLGKVAHDIRSPVASILGYAELLADSDFRHNDGFIDQTFEVINRQGRQVCQLLENAVLSAEVDAGRVPREFTEFELDEFLACIANEEEYRSTVDFHNEAGTVVVNGDPLSLRVAIRNLIQNGIKFSKSDEPVHIRMARARVPGWIEIQVQDHGIGIEDKDQAVLFRRFSRVRNESTQSIPGNGLGLYLAQRIVEKHGGNIHVDSTINAGSTFTIRLPIPAKSSR